MDQENEEIRSAFPEYLTNTQEDEKHVRKYQKQLDQCYEQFSSLINNYKDEQNILSAIESKITMVVNQTPISQIALFYENIAKDFDLQVKRQNIQMKIFKISKFHDQKHFPSIPILNDYFDKKINSLPWPIIGSIKPGELQEQLLKIYNFNYGRIALHELPMLWFPTIIKPYSNVIDALLNTQTKLAQYEKYYFAIMGAAASGSEQLFELLVQHFHLHDGDKNWIDLGFECVYDEIKELDTICKLLVQKPWDPQLKPALQQILKGKWNQKELIQSLLIYIFYNNIGCFSLGNGILKEIDHSHNLKSGNTSVSFTQQQETSGTIDFSQNEYIIQQLKHQSEDGLIEYQNIAFDKSIPNQDDSECDLDLQKLKFKEKFQKYFNVNEIQDSPGFQILRFSEYSFQMNSYPVLKSVFPEGASAINDFLKEVKHMTRNSFGNEQQITTVAFRKAIRVYGENIYRYQHDDIDYSTQVLLHVNQMNKLLPKELKAFIKTVSLSPNILCRKHIDVIPLTLTPDELCHITLLTVAAKIEVQLIYLSKALVDCM